MDGKLTAIACWENCMGKNLGLLVYSFWRVRIDLLFFYLSLLKMKRRIENEKILDICWPVCPNKVTI